MLTNRTRKFERPVCERIEHLSEYALKLRSRTETWPSDGLNYRIESTEYCEKFTFEPPNFALRNLRQVLAVAASIR